MKGFDTIARFRSSHPPVLLLYLPFNLNSFLESTAEIVEAGILNRLVLLLGNSNSAVQSKAYVLLFNAVVQTTPQQLVDAGIIPVLMKQLTPKQQQKANLYEMTFEFLITKIGPTFQKAMIEAGCIEASIDLLHNGSIPVPVKRKSLTFLKFLAGSTDL